MAKKPPPHGMGTILTALSEENKIYSKLIVEAAGRYLFTDFFDEDAFRRNYDPELMQSLEYLKDLVTRNFITDLKGLQEYYDNKRRDAAKFFEELEKLTPDELTERIKKLETKLYTN